MQFNFRKEWEKLEPDYNLLIGNDLMYRTGNIVV